MIEIKRSLSGAVSTKVKGSTFGIVEELLNGFVSIVELLVANDCLESDQVESFVEDFAEQVLDSVNIED